MFSESGEGAVGGSQGIEGGEWIGLGALNVAELVLFAYLLKRKRYALAVMSFIAVGLLDVSAPGLLSR